MMHARRDYTRRIQDVEGLIPDDEPVFLIRGKDIVGPEAVAYYAGLAEKAGADPELVGAVLAHAGRMKEWQAKNGAKVPDVDVKELV